METIRHRVGVDAPITDVYDAIATRDGTSSWWTRDVTGSAEVGERLTFAFGGPERVAVMEVTALSPDQQVHWTCVDGPDEWRDAPIVFDLHREDDQTIVLFSHGGWSDPAEFMHHCSSQWAYYLFSLKDGLEGRAATPWPDNDPISTWS